MKNYSPLVGYLLSVTNRLSNSTNNVKAFLVIVGFLSHLSISAQCVENNTNTASSATSSALVGQSFQASCSGLLSSIELQSTGSSSGLTISVYAGEGTGGTALGSVSGVAFTNQGVGVFESFDISAADIYLVDGDIYTLAFNAGSPTDVVYSTTNDYAEGSFYSVGVVDLTADLVFQANISAFSLEACSFLYITSAGPRTGLDTEAHIDESNCNIEPAAISYLATTPTPVFYFNIANGSATAEDYSDIIIRRANSLDLTTVIASAELFDGTNTRSGVISADNIAFGSLTTDVGIIPAESGTDEDDGKEFVMRVSFQSSINAVNQGNLDTEGLSFTLAGNADITSANASTIGGVWDGAAWNTGAAITSTSGAIPVTTSPTVQITGAPSSTNLSAFTVTFQFSEIVTTFALGDIDVTNGTAGSFAGLGSTYTADITPDGGGDITIEVPSGVAIDGASNGNILATPVTVTLDQTAPRVTNITRTTPSGQNTNATDVSWTVTFSEPVTGVANTDFDIAAGGATATEPGTLGGSSDTYTIGFSGVTEAGTGVLDLDLLTSGSIVDAVGNAFVNAVPTGNDETYIISQTAPRVTNITRTTPATQNTNATGVTWTVTFDKTVTGLANTDFDIVAGGATATEPGTLGGSGTTYTIAFTGVTEAGTGVLDLDLLTSGSIVDAFGNAFANATPTGNDETYVIDQTGPRITNITRTTPVGQNTNATGVTWTVTFDEPVTGVANTDFDIAAGGATATEPGTLGGSSDTYTIAYTGVTEAGSGVLDLDMNTSGSIVDAFGNTFSNATPTGNDETYVIDQTDPRVVSISRTTPSQQNTNATGVTWTVVFDEPVTGVANTDFDIAASGATATEPGTLGGSSDTYTMAFTGVSEAGTNVLDLDLLTSGSIIDGSGNGFSNATPTTTDETYIIDQSAPATPSVTTPAGPITIDATITTVAGTAEADALVSVYTDPNNDGDQADGVVVGTPQQLTGGAVAFSIADVTVAAGTANNYVVIATDAAGNESVVAADVPTVTDEDTPLINISNASTATQISTDLFFIGGEAITITDADNDMQTVDIAVTGGAGTFNLATTAGLSFNSGSDGSQAMNFTGSLVDVNAALNNASFSPGGVTGTQNIAISTTDGTFSDGPDNISVSVTINLAAGSIAFVGWNGEAGPGPGNTTTKGFAIVTLVPIDGSGTPVDILFTDKEWDNDAGNDGGDGGKWNPGEGVITWTISTLIPAGTVVDFRGVDGASLSASVGSLAQTSGTMSPGTNNDAIWAFTGTLSSPTPLAAISSDGDDGGGFSTLSGTTITGSGLTVGSTAIDLTAADNDFDNGEYAGLRTGQNSFAGYISLIANGANWSLTDGGTTNTVPDYNATAFTIDNIPPRVVSISRTTPAQQVTNATGVTFTVVFDEDVSGVANTDFVIAGGGASATTPGTLGGSGDTYTIAFTGAAEGGTNILNLDLVTSGSIQDLPGNSFVNAVPTTTDETYIIDNTQPTVVVTDDDADNIVRDGTVVNITATFTEANGLNGTPTIDIGSDISGASMSGAGLVWTYAYTVGSGSSSLNESAAITINVNDNAGNSTAAPTGTTSLLIDNTAPTVVLSDNDADDIVTDGNVVTITATFTEANGLAGTPTITIGTDISTPALMSGGPLVWTYNWTVGTNVTGLDEVANIVVSVNDAAGNANAAATGTTSLTIDNTQPEVMSIQRQNPLTSPTNLDQVVWDVEFNEAVLSVDATDFGVSGTTATIISAVDQGSNVYRVTASGGNLASLNGTVTLFIIGTNNITDLIARPLNLGPVPSPNENTYVIDNVSPTVVVSDDDVDNIVRDGTIVNITATFTELNGLNGTPTIDIGSDISGASMSGAGLVWTYAYTVGSGSSSLNENAAITINVNDNAGNATAAPTGTTSLTIDNTQPTVVVTDNDADDIVRDGTVVTIVATFTEANGLGGIPTVSIGSDIAAAPMAMSSPLVWRYDWTVGSGTPLLNESAAVSISVTDAAGNANTAATGTTSFTIDNTAPTVVVGDDDADDVVRDGTVVNITATFTEANGLTGIPSISIGNDIAGVAMAGAGLNWTYAWTVGSGTAALNENAAISISINDAAGNPTAAPTGTTSITIDNTPPTVTPGFISINTVGSGVGGTFLPGDVVTAQWNNTGTGDGNLDVVSVDIDFTEFGDVSSPRTATNAGNVWSASYTVVIGTVDALGVNVFVQAADAPGNTSNVEGVDDANVDTQLPIVSSGNIAITTTGSGTGGVFIAGDPVTVEWNNTGTGDNNGDINSVAVNFSEFGGPTLAAGEVAGTWSVTYNITAGSIDATGRNVFITATDDAGGSNVAVEGTDNVSVDNITPTITAVNISISGATGNGGAYIIGNTVTASWNNTAGGDNNGDVNGVTFDFTEFGGGAAVTATNSSDTWSAAFTLVDGIIDFANNRNVSISVSDDAGNVNTITDDANVPVDNVRPSQPSIPDLVAADDTGSSNTDNITSVAQPQFDGTGGVASNPIFLYTDDPAPNTRIDDGLIAANGFGNWSVDIDALTGGFNVDLTNNATHNIEATTFDAAGNESVRSTALVFQHITPPVISSSEWRDSDADGNIDILRVTFDKAVTTIDNDVTGWAAFSIGGGITFDNATDLDLSGTTIDFALTPVTGTGDPGQTVTYLTPNGNLSTIVENVGGIEMANGTNDTPLDEADPVVINSITLDTNLDGNVDRVELQLSESITDSNVNSDETTFSLTPAATFGTADNMSAFDTEVFVLAADNGANNEYIRFDFTPSNSGGTGIFTLAYAGSAVVDGNANVLSVPGGTVMGDGADPKVINFTTDLSPADDSPSVSNTNQITMKYSEQVSWDAANADIFFVQQIPPLTTTYSSGLNEDLISGAANLLSATDGTVTIDIPYTTNSNTDYYVVIESGAFVDVANNTSENQFNTASAWNFTTETALVIVNTATVGTTLITLEFNDAPSVATPTAGNFTVTDALGNPFTVTAINDIGGNDLQLTVNDFATAVGDLTLNYTTTTTVISAAAGTLLNFTGEVVDFDTSNPSLATDMDNTDIDSDTQITIRYAGGEPVQLTGSESPTDFDVVDGFGTIYTVTGISDPTPNDEFIRLTLTGSLLLSAVGDLQIDYTNNGGITDFGGNSASTQTVTVELDAVSPTLDGVAVNGTTQIDLDLSETVQILSAAPSNEFAVTDGAGNPFVISAISDVSTGDDLLELTVQNFATALGDLSVSYTPLSTQISDYGGNNLGAFSTSIDRDATPPSLLSATKINDTQVDVVFDEEVQIQSTDNDDFTVVDERGVAYPVTAVADGTPQDDVVELSFTDLSTAVGDLVINYTNIDSEVIDFGMNVAGSGSVTVDLDLLVAPALVEIPTTLTEDDLITDLAMYRSTSDPSALTAFTITPSINGSTVTIYRDAGLTDVVGTPFVGVTIGTGLTPTIGQIMAEDISNWAGSDDNGVYTFYVTETAQNSTPSESPSVIYSLAFQDDINNSIGGLSYSDLDNSGTTIGVSHPVANQDLLYTGNGLSNITYTPGSTSTARFVPSAAGIGSHQVTVEWENQTSGVAAAFQPTELDFTVNASSDVLFDNNANVFAKSGGAAILDVNNVLTGIDVAENGDVGDSDFYGLEVYHLVNGAISSIGGLQNIHAGTSAFSNSVISDGDDIATEVLSYDGSASSGGDNRSPFSDGTPAFVLDEWVFNPSAFSRSLGAQSVDTLRIVSISQADAGGSRAFISDVEVYLYPDPIVSVSNVGAQYCEDDGSFTIQADIQTYVGVGGVNIQDTDIANGYRMQYSADGTFAAPVVTDFTASGTLSNIFDPQDPDQDGDSNENETGFYRILYTSEPQTAANTTATDIVQLEVVAVATPPVLDIVSTGLQNSGGFNGANYVFEFCENETYPNIPIDVTATPADGGNTAYIWYNSNGTVITSGTATLTATELFGTTIVSGGVSRDIYVTRTFTSCESDSIPISIRTFDIPDEPAISLADNVANNLSQNIFEDNGAYFFEYCAGQDVAITYDQLVLTSTLEDIPDDRAYVENRSYFRIYDTDATTQLFDLTYNGGPYNIDILTDITGMTNQSSATANGQVTRDFYISKVVADSTLFDVTAPFDGCESGLTKVTVSINTYPVIPVLGDFTGDPNIDDQSDVDPDNDIINYYMCRGGDFPDIGIDPPFNAGDTEFEWYTDAGLTDQIVTDNRRGEVVSESDLVAHTTDAIANFDPLVSSGTPHTYYVRLLSRINENSGFTGCESAVRQVNLTVFPDVVKPVVTASGTELNDTQSNVGNFDHVYSFCVTAGVGLDRNALFSSAVSYSGSNQEVLDWYPANSTGDAVVGSSIFQTDASTNHDVTAFDLKIQDVENSVENFAVVYNTDFISNYNGFAGCFSVDTAYVQVIISTIPETAFTYSGLTAGELTTFDFNDPNSLASNVDVNFSIDEVGGVNETSYIDNINVNLSDADFTYSFPNAGIYDATLSITSAAGCVEVLTRRFRILEKIVISGNYIERFDDNDGGWFAEFRSDDGLSGDYDNSARVSSWLHGPAAGTTINNTHNGSGQGWTTTAGGGYQGGEFSYVYSPAFDISSLSNPAISFFSYRDMDGLKDGVVFQYSLNDGADWVTLGNFDDSQLDPTSGQSWYTTNGISSAPGTTKIGGSSVDFNDRRVGWADQYTAQELAALDITNGWAQSSHALTGIVGETNVRFRFALSASGASTDTKSGEGFGFDFLQLFELEKIVLIEQFSSSVSANSITINNSIVDPVSGIDKDGVMWINYFTDFANGSAAVDVLNQRNTTDPGARAAFYGIESAPRSVIDGNSIPQTDPAVKTWTNNDINLAALNSAAFTIPAGGSSITLSDQGTLSLTTKFISQIDTADIDYSFIFAVVEKEIEIGSLDDDNNPIPPIGQYTANGQIIDNVMRVLLPGPAGFNYVGDIASLEEFDYSVNWVIDNVYNASNLRVIVFVQDNDSKDVLQADYFDIANGAETITGLADINELSIYPNPADDLVSVELEKGLNEEAKWILFDQSGREVLKGVFPEGERKLKIKTEDIPSGMYLINIFSDDRSRKVARVIIAH